jgi:hypothetical protein
MLITVVTWVLWDSWRKKNDFIKASRYFPISLIIHSKSELLLVPIPYASTAGNAAQDHRTKIRGQTPWRRKLYYGS